VFDKPVLQPRPSFDEKRQCQTTQGSKAQQAAKAKWLETETSSDSDMYGSNELEEGNVDGDTDEYDCNEIYWRQNKRERPTRLYPPRNCPVSSGSDVTPDSAVVADVESLNR
jgi:hypothetical protein